MATKKIGQRVVVTAGMKEFIGATGEIIDNTERDGATVMYRVKLFKPVEIPGVGTVTDDLWSGAYLRNVRTQGTLLRQVQYVPEHYHNHPEPGETLGDPRGPAFGKEPDEIMAANDGDFVL
jgi:hypothetical protein